MIGIDAAARPWWIAVAVAVVLAIAAGIADWRRSGKVHPAWLGGAGLILGAQILGSFIAYTSLGVSLTELLLAGSPGAERPMAAYLPPGFAM